MSGPRFDFDDPGQWAEPVCRRCGHGAADHRERPVVALTPCLVPGCPCRVWWPPGHPDPGAVAGAVHPESVF